MAARERRVLLVVAQARGVAVRVVLVAGARPRVAHIEKLSKSGALGMLARRRRLARTHVIEIVAALVDVVQRQIGRAVDDDGDVAGAQRDQLDEVLVVEHELVARHRLDGVALVVG